MPSEAWIWGCVGSAGAVNPPDLGKVVLNGSIVQLGIGIKSPEAAARGAGPETQAVIRYGVTGIDTWPNPIPKLGLALLCRPGGGQIAARLVEVLMEYQGSNLQETTVVESQSQAGGANRNAFSIQAGIATNVGFTFGAFVYYVEVVLTAPAEVVLEYPPAVSAIQLIFVSD